MGVYINMEMPKDCPMCILAHYNKQDEFTGCEIVPGKKYAVSKDSEYANSSTRPDWCPLVPVPDHGRLIDAAALEEDVQKRLLICNKYDDQFQKPYEVMRAIALAPTIIQASKEET